MCDNENKMLREKEKEIIELRNRVKFVLPLDIYEDKTTLFRFLKARNFNLDDTEKMLRKHLDWRKILQLDSILTDYHCPEVLNKYVSQSFIGKDRKGNIVRFSNLGNVDQKGIFRSANKSDVLKCSLQLVEGDLKVLKSDSKEIDCSMAKCVYIYDLKNLTLAQVTDRCSIDLFIQGITIFQDNYPELLHSIYVINASKFFEMVFPIFKSFLAYSVIGKIKVFAQDGWKEELLKIIDPDVLPAFLGGNRVDPDGNTLCKTFINHGGTVPRKYYLTKNVGEFARRPGVKKTIVNKHAFTRIEHKVDHPGVLLELEFLLKDHDIGFTLTLQTESKEIELVPYIRVETEYTPHKASYGCHRAGTYIVTLDNTHSRFFIKEIYYAISIRAQDQVSVKH